MTYRVELFANAKPGVHSATSGQTSLGTIEVTTNDRGVGRFQFFLSTRPVHTFFTANATSTVNNTSEFSNAIPGQG